MADHHHHHHQHRPHRLSLPSRATIPTSISTLTPRPSYPLFPYPPSTPTPTPSKHRLSSLSATLHKPPTKKSSFSSLLLLLFSLRSLYSLLPFLRSSPNSFSIFPFAFLVSLFSFLLTLSFSLFTSQKQRQPILSLTLITYSQHRLLLAKSLLLAFVFLLRFQALLYCGTAATILAELSGNVAARFVAEGRDRDRNRIGSPKVRGLFVLFIGLFLLSISWDRIECFPLSSVNVGKIWFSMLPRGNCIRVWPMLLPFLSGFLGCYERVSMNWGTIRELGRKRVRLISLFLTTAVLFIPAVVSMFMFEAEGDSISIGSLGWPLANTVVFGVLLSENYSDEKLASSKDFQREFLVTFVCTLVLELFYFPELSLWGLLICGTLIGIAVRELDPVYSNYLELGLESSESFTTSIMKPVRHILSERKSRKIALFLLINTAYMVVEFAAGFMSNSLGLISDACHMLFDCAALAIGLYASYISRLPANTQFNYGRGRFEVLSGYVNAVFLVLVGALIVLESFERILDPQEISTGSLLTVSIGGLLVNMVGLIFFHDEHHHAHGGSGSCSHSQSHSHSHQSHDHEAHSTHHGHSHQHDHHSHDHGGHDHVAHSKHHDHSHHHDHHSHDHGGHDHEAHSKHHDHSHHDHHSHQHGGRDHEAHSNHHECIDVSHDSHEKSCSTHSDQCSDRHEHHDCNHNHNAGDHHHDHHDHHHHHHSADHHPHGSNPLNSLKSLHSHPDEGHSGEDTHSHGDPHSHTHTLSGNSGSKPQRHHHHIDHNMEGIFLHVLADTMGSVGVVLSTLLIKYKGWLAADPVCSIFISVLIVSSVIPLLRNSAEVLLQRVPRAHEHDLNEALNDVMKMKGVRGIQNLHVWSLTNSEVVGTLHLHVSAETDRSSAKAKVSDILQNAGVKDLTVQVECVKGN